MKRVLFFIAVTFFTINSFAQFSDTAALNTYIRDTIKDKRPEKVTAAQIQKALLGTTRFLKVENFWNLSGNSGTNPGTDFIGTTDAQDFAVKTNNTLRVLSTYDGRFKVGNEDFQNAGRQAVFIDSVDAANTVSIENPRSGTGACEQLALFQNFSNYAEILKYNSSYVGNYLGTSIPAAGTLYLATRYNSADFGSPILMRGSSLITLPSQTGTDYGIKADKFGLRVDKINALHTSNGPRILYVNGSIGANKDSVTRQTVSGARHMLVMDTTSGKFERMPISTITGAVTFDKALENGSTLTWDRHINLNNRILSIGDASYNPYLYLDPYGDFAIGDFNGATTGTGIWIQRNSKYIFMGNIASSSGSYLEVSDFDKRLLFHNGGEVRFQVKGDGRVAIPNYGADTITGIPASLLAVDSSGNMIEMDVSDVVSQANSTIRPASWSLNNFTDSANFNTSMGCTFSGGKIVVNSGDVLFNSWLSFKDTVCSNHWRMSARCSNVSVQTTTTTYGFSVGMRSVNSFSKNSFAAFPNTSSDAFSGRFEFFVQANSNSFYPLFRMGAGSTVTNAQNDKLIVSMERNNSTITITVYNETTKAVAADTTITISLESGAAIMPNTAVPTIWFHSTAGTIQVDSIYFQDFEAKNADILFLGDSKTHGLGASSFTNTWPSILAQSYPNYAICAGTGDRTQDIKARLNQIIALKPKVVVAAFGSNDVREGVWNSTGQTNYTYIDSALMANGIYVLHCLPFKENTLDLTAQKNWIAANAQFTGRIIDTWTPALEAGLLHSDGIHLIDRGNRRIATAIKTSPLLLNRGIRVENVNQ